jgi:hypothetical protein
VSLTGIALEDLQEGKDPLGQVFSALGAKWDGNSTMSAEGRFIALDISGCTGNTIGSIIASSASARPHDDIYDNTWNRQRLVSIRFPPSLEYIGDYTFFYCRALESVELLDGLKVIGHKSFGTSGLLSVELPDSLEFLSAAAFTYGLVGEAQGLISVKLPASLKVIPSGAFSKRVLNTIELPRDLEIIGAQAFQHSSLRSISFPDTLTTIKNSAFSSTKQLESVQLPASLTTLGHNAFRFSGIKSADLSACVDLEIIQECVFDECLSLESVQLPPNLKGIDGFAFSGCSLKVLDLPASVEIIEYLAFRDASIGTLIVRSVEPPSKLYGSPDHSLTYEYDPSWTYTLTIPASVIYVPDGSIEAYRTSPWWGIHASKFRPLSEYEG